MLTLKFAVAPSGVRCPLPRGQLGAVRWCPEQRGFNHSGACLCGICLFPSPTLLLVSSPKLLLLWAVVLLPPGFPLPRRSCPQQAGAAVVGEILSPATSPFRACCQRSCRSPLQAGRGLPRWHLWRWQRWTGGLCRLAAEWGRAWLSQEAGVSFPKVFCWCRRWGVWSGFGWSRGWMFLPQSTSPPTLMSECLVPGERCLHSWNHGREGQGQSCLLWHGLSFLSHRPCPYLWASLPPLPSTVCSFTVTDHWIWFFLKGCVCKSHMLSPPNHLAIYSGLIIHEVLCFFRPSA